MRRLLVCRLPFASNRIIVSRFRPVSPELPGARHAGRTSFVTGRAGPNSIREIMIWFRTIRRTTGIGNRAGAAIFSILFFCIFLFEFLAGVVAASSDVARVGWYEWFRCQHTHGLRDSMLGEIIFPTMGPPTYQKISMIKRCQYQAIRHSFLNLSDIFRNDFDSFWQKSAH